MSLRWDCNLIDEAHGASSTIDDDYLDRIFSHRLLNTQHLFSVSIGIRLGASIVSSDPIKRLEEGSRRGYKQLL